jgi:hypothetical protein
VISLAIVLTAHTSQDIPIVNQRLLAYASAQIGKRVAGGQCAGLVNEGLRIAKAKPYGSWADWPTEGDYVWGDRITVVDPENTNINQVKPGDILQYRNVRIVSKTGNSTRSFSAPQHTAIVESVDPQTNQVTVLQQNFNNNQKVTRDPLTIRGIRAGTIYVYRPVPLESRR